MLTIARYSLVGLNLPLVGDTLPVTEALRRALMSQYRTLKEIERYGRVDPPNAPRFVSRTFSGKDDDGGPLRDDHDHAFYLPTDEDGDGRLDHLTVFAHGGFVADEIRALVALTWIRCGKSDLSVLLVGLGHEAELRRYEILGPSTVWISASPFLVTRHMKRRGQKRDPREFFEASGWAGSVCQARAARGARAAWALSARRGDRAARVGGSSASPASDRVLLAPQ